MEKRHHKHHKSHSPHDVEEQAQRKRKSHKRHHMDSSSEDEDSNRKRQHKHRHKERERRQHYSGEGNDDSDDMRSGNRNGTYCHLQEGNDDDHSSRKDRKNRHKSDSRADRNSRMNEDGDRHHRHRSQHGAAQFDPSIQIKQEKDDRNYQEQHRERQENNQRRQEARMGRDRAGGDHGLNTDAPIVKSEPGTTGNADGGGKENSEDGENTQRQKPNFELSGKLTEDTNMFRGVVIKYNEPPEAMKPKRRWRLYPFKGQESLPVLHIHRQSAFLLGRDRRIADIPVDHPSCSKQQAVLQFRAMPYTRPDNTPGRRVRPYIIDLESANGTYLNGEQVEARRYYELKEKDVIKFGFSSREYVILHDAVDVSEVADGEDMEEA